MTNPKLKNHLCCLILLLLPFTALIGQEEGKLIDEFSKTSIKNTLNQLPIRTEFSIALIKDGKQEFYGVTLTDSGMIELENKHKSYEIGSITKVFTCQLLIQTIKNEDLASLDEPIGKYLPEDIKAEVKDISFRQLANHTAGLERNPSNMVISFLNMNDPFADYGEKQLLAYLRKKVKLQSTPGDSYQYSNLGMGLLGYLITQINEAPFEKLLQEHIFQTLEMDKTTSQLDLVKGEIVQGLNVTGTNAPNWNFDALAPAGSILSTTEDLSKYARWCFKAFEEDWKILTEKTFTINEGTEIALGWHIIKGYTDKPFIWHNGGTGGYRSSMAVDIPTNTSVIILSNMGSGNVTVSLDKLCFELMAHLQAED